MLNNMMGVLHLALPKLEAKAETPSKCMSRSKIIYKN